MPPDPKSYADWLLTSPDLVTSHQGLWEVALGYLACHTPSAVQSIPCVPTVWPSLSFLLFL